MKKKRPIPAEASEAEIAAPSVSELSLDNLEDRVEALRHASEPTRQARAAINRVSRAEAADRQKKKHEEEKKKKR
jgi:hypothetical protein